MNDFFGNVGKKVNKTTKKALKVSGDMLELTKTSVNIKLEESKKENFYKEIGKLIYEDYTEKSTVISEDVINLCKCIDEINSAISAQKSQVAKIKNQKFCISCGQTLDLPIVYCFACGVKQPELPKQEEEEECCDCCESNDDACCSDDSCDCGCAETQSTDKCCEDVKCECDTTTKTDEDKCCSDGSCDTEEK